MARPARIRLFVLALGIGAIGLGAVLLTHGGHTASTVLPSAAGDGQSEPLSRVSFLQKLIPPPAQRVSGPSAPTSIADLARRLPLERAVAQLFLFGFHGKRATAPVFEQLRRLDLGGLVLDGRNYDTPQQLAALAGRLKALPARRSHLPLWLMAQQDGADHSQFPDLPPSQAPGDFGTPAEAAAAMTEAMTALKALGLNGFLEPELDLSSEGGGALGTLTLSSDPAAVADYARQVVATCRHLVVLCAAKHFPGIGAASIPTDQGPAQIGLSMAALHQRDLVPFAAAVRSGIPAMVVGEGLYETDSFVTPATLSSAIIGGLLRRELRFGGLAITDDLADPGVSALTPAADAAVAALRAGADMVYISGDAGDQEAAYNAVLNAVRGGRVPEARVRQALLRVLLTKRSYGLLR